MRFSFSSILLAAIVAFLIYNVVSWQKSGKIIGFAPYKYVDLINLLSYGNLYDGRKVCTRGYFVSDDNMQLLKVSMSDDQFTRSMWVENISGKDIILISFKNEGVTDAKLCGKYHFKRAGEWGNPAVWNHMIEVDKFDTYGEATPVQ